MPADETSRSPGWVIEYTPNEDAGFIGYYDNGWHPETHIQFQHGPISEHGINGIQNEELIKLLIMRLKSLNEKFPCKENETAILSLETGLLWLEYRTKLRQEQGVEGKNEAHRS